MSVDPQIMKSFRVSKALNDRFLKKYPSRGSQSNILRGLLQMHLNGEIPVVKYRTEFNSTISNKK